MTIDFILNSFPFVIRTANEPQKGQAENISFIGNDSPQSPHLPSPGISCRTILVFSSQVPITQLSSANASAGISIPDKTPISNSNSSTSMALWLSACCMAKSTMLCAIDTSCIIFDYRCDAATTNCPMAIPLSLHGIRPGRYKEIFVYENNFRISSANRLF